MLTVEFTPDANDELLALAAEHPNEIEPIAARHLDGSAITFLISASAILVPAIKAVLVEKIRAGRIKSFKTKGLTITGASAEEIATLLKTVHELELKG